MDRNAPAAPPLQLEGVDVDLGERAVLRGVDLTVRAGEAVALVGPSGSGKTTLLRLLGGGLTPARGTVRLLGEDRARLDGRGRRALRARLGFVHQDLALVPNLRVAQNVIAGRLGRRGFWGGARSMLRPREDELLAVHALLERLGIGPTLHRRTDRLSGGEQQRVALARALHQDPEVLLADEPVAAVDPARARDLVTGMVELARERGLTLVCSLHDLALARALVPRVVGLRAGRVAFDLPTAEVDDARFAALYELDPA